MECPHVFDAISLLQERIWLSIEQCLHRRHAQCAYSGSYENWWTRYSLTWEEGRCINTVPVPSGRPTYTTMLACCTGEYAGQNTRECKNAIPIDNSTVQNGTLFYPDYSLAWDEGTCIKTLPIPPGRPTFATLLTCCAIAYAGQYSQACTNSVSIINNATNSSLFYPNYSLAWDVGKCINQLPIPSGWPTYSTQLACCKAAYADQQSKACIQSLPSPPTSSPTKTGGPDIYYPDYSLPWPEGRCINTVPVPSGRVTYTTKLACCAGAYAGQASGACVLAANA